MRAHWCGSRRQPCRTPLRVPGCDLCQRVHRPSGPVSSGQKSADVSSGGGRDILGVTVCDSEDTVFWTAFLTGLKGRRLPVADFMISDAHRGPAGVLLEDAAGIGQLALPIACAAKRPRARSPRTDGDGRRVRPNDFRKSRRGRCRPAAAEVATRLDLSLSKAAGVLADSKDATTAYAVFPRHVSRTT